MEAGGAGDAPSFKRSLRVAFLMVSGVALAGALLGVLAVLRPDATAPLWAAAISLFVASILIRGRLHAARAKGSPAFDFWSGVGVGAVVALLLSVGSDWPLTRLVAFLLAAGVLSASGVAATATFLARRRAGR